MAFGLDYLFTCLWYFTLYDCHCSPPDVDSTLMREASVIVHNSSPEEYLTVAALPAGVTLNRTSNSSILLQAADGLDIGAFESLLGNVQYSNRRQRYDEWTDSDVW